MDDPNRLPDITITIGDKPFMLVPSLGELKALQKKVGGLLKLMGRFAEAEATIEDLAMIVLHGILGDPRQECPSLPVIEQAIFDEGMLEFLKPCSEFVKRVVADGARRKPDPKALAPTTSEGATPQT